MSRWLLVAPNRPDDEALAQTAWIARVTHDSASEKPAALFEGDATRARFERAIRKDGEIRGVAFFGHGSDNCLYDAECPPKTDGSALLDLENITITDGRWVHALACLSGAELAIRAADAGADIYVGYKSRLIVDWTTPVPHEALFIELVSCVTHALARGERDKHALQRMVSNAVDAFVVAIGFGAEAPWAFAFAEQLRSSMVVHPDRRTGPG